MDGAEEYGRIEEQETRGGTRPDSISSRRQETRHMPDRHYKVSMPEAFLRVDVDRGGNKRSFSRFRRTAAAAVTLFVERRTRFEFSAYYVIFLV